LFEVSVPVGASPYDVSVADINQDTFVDIIVTNNGANTISILLNKGNRVFFQQQSSAGSNPLGIWVAGETIVFSYSQSLTYPTDFNGDGLADVAVSTGNSIGVMPVTEVLPNSVTFGQMVFYGTGSSPAEIVGADFNKDGRIDLAVPNYYSNTVSVLLNVAMSNGPIAFAAPVNYATGNRPWGIDAGDLNLDNLTDLVITNVAENTVSILYGVSLLEFSKLFLTFFVSSRLWCSRRRLRRATA
jgi:hypothetical protein